jgi:hypothetical protein
LRVALGTAYSTHVREYACRIDVGVRNVVTLLNHITGVTTRASCEGAGPQLAGHVHAALAYVAFRRPMPLQLQEFLVTRLGSLARIENDAIYCRWPIRNRVFLGSLESAARLYLTGSDHGSTRSVRWPLARLRARLARQVARRHAGEFRLCLTCRELVATPHPEAHQSIRLLRLPADLHDRWFAEFLTQPGNALDAKVVASDGWARLLARTQRGDFGSAFQRRWLRYRARRVAEIATQDVRHGVEAARRHGVPIDFFHDGTHAIFAWKGSTGDGSTSKLSDLEACSDPTRPPEASGVRAGSGPWK